MKIDRPITLVYARGEDGLFGKGRGMPWRVSKDARWFKYITMGTVLVMGSNTFDGLPVMPGRSIIILSKNVSHHIVLKMEIDSAKNNGQYIEIVGSLDEVQKVLDHHCDKRPVTIIGGANLLEQTVEFANDIYCTVIPEHYYRDVTGDKVFLTPLIEETIMENFHLRRIHLLDPKDHSLKTYHYKSNQLGETP